MKFRRRVACFLLTLVAQTSSQYGVKNLGKTVTLGGVSYFLPGSPEVVISVQHGAFGLPKDTTHLLPVTHVQATEASGYVTSVQKYLDSYAKTDDVWSEAFGHYIFTSGKVTASSSKPGTQAQIVAIDATSPLAALSHLPAGPYFAEITRVSISIFKAYRVYPDPAGSFYYGVLQQADGTFEVLASTSPSTNGEGGTVAVPSRLYFSSPSAKQPLSGVRVGVKDLYDLKGLRKSAGSRAYFETYGPANETAPSIQYLIDLGAVVVGRTRTSQFANGQAPTADWVDYHDPFNARGDGYQDSSSSSAGAGSATSNYDWIDMNIGSDTGGSVRAPAAVAGVFGNRPSQDIMTLDGVLPLSAYMDTPAFMARSASNFATWGKAWYGAANASLKSYSKFPSKRLYPIDIPGINTTKYPSPGFFPSTDNNAQAIFDKFTKNLEAFLGVKKTVLDFYTEYKETSGAKVCPLDQLRGVWELMTAYEQYRSVVSPLKEAYGAINNGDHPYLDPPVAENAAYGAKATEALFNEALTNKTMFKNWLDSHVLTPELSSAHCSSALLIHPIWSGTPSYRDNYPTESPADAGESFVWNQYSISQLAGVPEVVLPVGEVEYTSRVTVTTKKLPVVVSINAAAGCDLMLYELVSRLAEEGIIPNEVKTGATLF
ncbi:amidase signature domain-containing protein [Xylariaceae sp. FL0255]|nr:amidase signature domain-containing protein [Xylariaceae sp. FL0255]